MIWFRILAVALCGVVLSSGCSEDDTSRPSQPAAVTGSTPPLGTIPPAPGNGAGEELAEGTGPPPPASPVPTTRPAPTPTSPPHEPVVATDNPVPDPAPTPEPLACEPDEFPVDSDGDGEADDCVPAFDLNLSTPEPTAAPEPAPQPTAAPVPTAASEPTGPDPEVMAEAAAASPWAWFGDGVYSWSAWEIVVHRVPVSGVGVDYARRVTGAFDAPLADTEESRRWLAECANRKAERSFAHRASFGVAPYEPAAYGEATANAVESCVRSLLRMNQLTARYLWDAAGTACLSDLMTEWASVGDAAGLPLAVCASVGYDPTAPRPEGWLAARCAEIVAANPNPAYPTDPHASYLVGESLPSCWDDIVAIVEAHAAERVALGLPFGPHDCFHAYLTYVVARQTGLESRPPRGHVAGCNYSLAGP